jgi:hypothetical protein
VTSPRIQVLRAGYVVGKVQLRTVVALEAELIRRNVREARVVPAIGVSFRKVAAVVRVCQRRGIFLGFIGNVQRES